MRLSLTRFAAQLSLKADVRPEEMKTLLTSCALAVIGCTCCVKGPPKPVSMMTLQYTGDALVVSDAQRTNVVSLASEPVDMPPQLKGFIIIGAAPRWEPTTNGFEKTSELHVGTPSGGIVQIRQGETAQVPIASEKEEQMVEPRR